MQLKRGLISYLLLLCYSIVFAHDSIPHCHHDGSDAGHVVQHEHVQEDACSHDEHAHIEHDSHVDENVVDYLSCVLSQVEHPANGVEDCSFLVARSEQTGAKLGLRSFTLPIDDLSISASPGIPLYLGILRLAPPLPPYLAKTSTRGPPGISC